MRLAGRFLRSIPLVVLLFVLGFSLVYALAWVQLYRQDHPYQAASRWIFDNVPQGSSLAGPHWDDRLPISIPGKDAPRYFSFEGKDSELPFYEGDTPQKLNLVLKRTAQADYIVFPTARTPDSIPRVPEEYPYTTAYLQLLWSEKLGFTFENSVKTRPSFFGVTFNDDLADESFSVYDHPKVVIFKNVERLSPEQMFERVMNAKRYEPLPSLDEILLMDQGGWSATATMPDPRPWQISKAFVVLLVLAFCFWILVGSHIGFLPDGGLGISFLGGILLSGGISALLAAAGFLTFNSSAAVLTWGLIVVAAIVSVLTSSRARARLADISLSHITLSFLAIFVGVVLVVGTRKLYPEYFWSAGDLHRFSLAFFSRNELIPPAEGWSAGTQSGGATLQYVLAGWLAKLFGTRGAFSYELSFIVLGGALGGALYSLSSAVVRRPVYSFVVTLVAFVPAIRGAHMVLHGYSPVGTAQAEAALDPNQQRLVEWLSSNIKGAPLVVEACDETASLSIAQRAGLPSVRESLVGKSDGSLEERERVVKIMCSLQDPDATFGSMMANGIGILIIPGREGEVTATRRDSMTRFLARRDLFAPVYVDGGSAVLTAPFSKFFPQPQAEVNQPD